MHPRAVLQSAKQAQQQGQVMLVQQQHHSPSIGTQSEHHRQLSTLPPSTQQPLLPARQPDTCAAADASSTAHVTGKDSISIKLDEYRGFARTMADAVSQEFLAAAAASKTAADPACETIADPGNTTTAHQHSNKGQGWNSTIDAGSRNTCTVPTMGSFSSIVELWAWYADTKHMHTADKTPKEMEDAKDTSWRKGLAKQRWSEFKQYFDMIEEHAKELSASRGSTCSHAEAAADLDVKRLAMPGCYNNKKECSVPLFLKQYRAPQSSKPVQSSDA